MKTKIRDYAIMTYTAIGLIGMCSLIDGPMWGPLLCCAIFAHGAYLSNKYIDYSNYIDKHDTKI